MREDGAHRSAAQTALPAGERIDHRVLLAAQPDDVWTVLCRPQWDAWVEGTLAVHDPTGPASPGMTYGETNRLLGPLRAQTRWEVVAFDPPRFQRHEGTGAPFIDRFAVEWRLDAAPTGTFITMTFDVRPSPGLGLVLYRLALRRRLRHSLRSSLAALGSVIDQPQVATTG